jgi:parallel beta-helix repeat protein
VVAPDGNDSNPGTLGLPFATLSRAAGAVTGGDTVYLRGGTYQFASAQGLGPSGSAGAHVLFQSYPGETAILDGSRLPAGTNAVAVSGRYIDLENFRVRGAKQDDITIGGQYITLQNLEVSGAAHNGIAVWGGSHVRLLTNTVHDNQYAGVYSGYSSTGVVSDVLVDGNTVYHNSLMNSPRTLGGGWPAAVGGQLVAGYTITNNAVYDNYGEGIDFSLDDGGLASGNSLHDNYSVEMYLDNATRVTLRQNWICTTNDTGYYRHWGGVYGPATSIQVANESYAVSNPCDYDTIINNIATGGTWGFNYGSYKNGGGLKNFLIANNTFYSAPGSMLHIDGDAGHLNTVFENNVFDQTGGRPMVELNGLTGFSNLTFATNLWFGGSAGPAAGAGDVNADPLLANPRATSAAGYKLTANSPAIDKGTTIAAVATDYFGTARPQGGAYDIGAHEYIAAPGTPPASGYPSPATAGALPPLLSGTAARPGERGDEVGEAQGARTRAPAGPSAASAGGGNADLFRGASGWARAAVVGGVFGEWPPAI